MQTAWIMINEEPPARRILNNVLFVSPPQHQIPPLCKIFSVCEIIWKHFDKNTHWLKSGKGPENVRVVYDRPHKQWRRWYPPPCIGSVTDNTGYRWCTWFLLCILQRVIRCRQFSSTKPYMCLWHLELNVAHEIMRSKHIRNLNFKYEQASTYLMSVLFGWDYNSSPSRSGF